MVTIHLPNGGGSVQLDMLATGHAEEIADLVMRELRKQFPKDDDESADENATASEPKRACTNGDAVRTSPIPWAAAIPNADHVRQLEAFELLAPDLDGAYLSRMYSVIAYEGRRRAEEAAGQPIDGAVNITLALTDPGYFARMLKPGVAEVAADAADKLKFAATASETIHYLNQAHARSDWPRPVGLTLNGCEYMPVLLPDWYELAETLSSLSRTDILQGATPIQRVIRAFCYKYGILERPPHVAKMETRRKAGG